MTNCGKCFADELTNCLIYETGFNQSKFKVSVYYNFSTYGSKIVVLSYVDYCVYWYMSEKPGNWFVDTLIKIFHMDFLGYAHLFMSIRISQLRNQSIQCHNNVRIQSCTFVIKTFPACVLQKINPLL